MQGSEPHAQASIWLHRDLCLAVLALEGEAPDRSNGGVVAEDAFYWVALAYGLRLTTDLDHLALRSLAGWRVLIDDVGRVTLR